MADHFVVKVQGKQTVHVYFAQTAPLTACVAKITIRDGEEVKHRVIAQGSSFCKNMENAFYEWMKEVNAV